jgi:predicted esterase
MSSADAHVVEVRTHGRYLIDQPQGDGPFPLLVGFHGYKENAEHMLRQLARLDPRRQWLLVSVQALNRFYNRANEVVANWMTRQDRELAIADNIAYVTSVIAEVRRNCPVSDVLVYVGFSQGVAMSYRAAAFAAPATALIVLAGDVPPDVAPVAGRLPPVLIGRGIKDEWYTASKAEADAEVLQHAGTRVTTHVFEGGHEWDDAFVTRASDWLNTLG